MGSSAEGLRIAETVRNLLDPVCDVELWTQDISIPPEGTLASLETALPRPDFALFVLTADDLTVPRGTWKATPQDGILFALALFMGRLGRERTFVLFDRTKSAVLPSNLTGATAVTFAPHASGSLEASLGAPSTRIREVIERLGIRRDKGLQDPEKAEAAGQARLDRSIAEQIERQNDILAEMERRRKQQASEQIEQWADLTEAPIAEAQMEQEIPVQATQLEPPKIFLCYRREDTQGFARGIYLTLASKYGNSQVFRDIDSTPPGVKFAAWIEARVAQCSVMIVLIGNAWVTDQRQQRRLDSPKDWVRHEIEAALRRDIPIIPVRVQGAPMPSEDELPPSIADLTGFQSAEVTDSRWNYDMGLLIQAIDNSISSGATHIGAWTAQEGVEGIAWSHDQSVQKAQSQSAGTDATPPLPEIKADVRRLEPPEEVPSSTEPRIYIDIVHIDGLNAQKAAFREQVCALEGVEWANFDGSGDLLRVGYEVTSPLDEASVTRIANETGVTVERIEKTRWNRDD
jgi:hypothetical protein